MMPRSNNVARHRRISFSNRYVNQEATGLLDGPITVDELHQVAFFAGTGPRTLRCLKHLHAEGVMCSSVAVLSQAAFNNNAEYLIQKRGVLGHLSSKKQRVLRNHLPLDEVDIDSLLHRAGSGEDTLKHIKDLESRGCHYPTLQLLSRALALEPEGTLIYRHLVSYGSKLLHPETSAIVRRHDIDNLMESCRAGGATWYYVQWLEGRVKMHRSLDGLKDTIDEQFIKDVEEPQAFNAEILSLIEPLLRFPGGSESIQHERAGPSELEDMEVFLYKCNAGPKTPAYMRLLIEEGKTYLALDDLARAIRLAYAARPVTPREQLRAAGERGMASASGYGTSAKVGVTRATPASGEKDRGGETTDWEQEGEMARSSEGAAETAGMVEDEEAPLVMSTATLERERRILRAYLLSEKCNLVKDKVIQNDQVREHLTNCINSPSKRV
jgi:hypothetical protein